MADDLDELRAALRADAAEVGRALLGEPNKATSNRNTLRFGRKSGSLVLEIRGPKKGLWREWGGTEGSDLLGLIQHAHNCDFPAALDWARRWTGGQAQPAKARPRPVDYARAAAEAADLARRIADARRRWAAGVPIPGTIAERYLNQTRGIPRTPEGWPPDALRFHPGDQAWMLALTTSAGEVNAVQYVHLDANAEKDPSRPRPKLTHGPMAGACVRLPGKEPALVAEGPETGVAAWVSTGHATLISCGPVGRLKDIPKRAVILQDDDPRHGPTDKALTKALRDWRGKGCNPVLCTPWGKRRHDKSDMADLIFAEGAEAVRARIERAIGTGLPKIRRVTVRKGRDELLPQAMAPLFAAAAEASCDPIVHAIRGSTGLGKSVEIRRQVAEFIRTIRAKGDRRAAVIAVPRHNLADQYANLLREVAPDLAVRVWRGRTRPDPDRPGAKMCGDPDAVKAARAAHLDVDQFACGPCELRPGCAHWHQRHSEADVWIAPHSLLANAPPKAFGPLAVLVIDENPIGEFLLGVDPLHPLHLPLDSFERCPDIQPREDGVRLRELSRKAVEVLRADAAPGPILHAPFEAQGFTRDDALTAARLTWRAKQEPRLAKGTNRADRLEAMRAAATANRDLTRRVMWWHALADLMAPTGPAASGKASFMLSEADGDPRPVIRLKGCAALRAGWQVPTLICDATLEAELLRPIWPGIELKADIAAAAPHQSIRQVTDRAYSLAMLDPGPEPDPKRPPSPKRAAERKRRLRNLRDLHAIICREARQAAPGKTLVIAQLRIRALLEAMGNMPAGVEWGHHNGLTGMDDWKHVRLIIVIGRTLPSPAAMEDHAEALTGAAVQRLPPGDWYPRVDVRREMSDGVQVAAEAEQHPNPTAELFRRAACEHQLVQGIGRGRGGDRTAVNPLDILLLCDVPVDLPVGRCLAASDVAPSPADLMLSLGGIAYAEPGAAIEAYGDFGGTRNTLGLAMREAERSARFPYKDSYYGNRADLCRVRYQRAGLGHRPAEAWVDQAMVGDPRAAIEAHQGPLASFEVIVPEPPAVEASAGVAPERVWGAGALSPPTRPSAGPMLHAGAAWGAAP